MMPSSSDGLSAYQTIVLSDNEVKNSDCYVVCRLVLYHNL